MVSGLGLNASFFFSLLLMIVYNTHTVCMFHDKILINYIIYTRKKNEKTANSYSPDVALHVRIPTHLENT